MENEPLVSVLMTAYNREDYITEAIESVLSSTYSNFELIVVDDGSKDKTVSIARGYEEKDRRVRLHLNEKNLGDYRNRNRAASYAKGEFIMSVDSDDYIYKDGMERVVKLMVQHPEANFGMYCIHPADAPFVLDSATAINDHFFRRSFLSVGPGGTIIKRSFFEQIGRYPVKYGPANDMYFNLKAVAQTPVLMLPFEYFHYRRHEGQEINNQYGYLYNGYTYMRDALNELDLPIERSKIEWLHKKNKRRFVVNVFNYLKTTRDFSRSKQAIKKADFSLKDALDGVFH